MIVGSNEELLLKLIVMLLLFWVEVNLSLMFGKDNDEMILLKHLKDREGVLLKKLNHDCDVLLFHLSNVF